MDNEKYYSVRKCKKCGCIKWEFPGTVCANCGSTLYDEVTYPGPTREEIREMKVLQEEAMYLLDKEFALIKPKPMDFFGCIELCDHLKKKYKLTDDVYELAGLFNEHFYAHFGFKAFLLPKESNLLFEDGRLVQYHFLFYKGSFDPCAFPIECSQTAINEFNSNPKYKIEKMIQTAKKYKKYKYIQIMGSQSFGYELLELKKAREHVMSIIESQIPKVKKNQRKLNVRNFVIFLLVVSVITFLLLFKTFFSDNSWNDLSREEQEWYEENYGDGKIDDINDAIKDYRGY